MFAADILIKQSKQSKKIMAELADNRVKLYPDGKYRWVYEVPMLKNPTILIDVFKVLGISFGIVWLSIIINQ